MEKIIEMPNFFNSDECESYMRNIDNHDRKTSFSNSNMFESNKFFDKNVLNHIFKTLKRSKIKNIKRLNPLVLTARYNPGEKSHLHMDVPFDDEVKYTLLVYLNDNFSGGETKFYDDDFKLIKTIKPEKGKGLFFDINIFHQGETVISGNKYWIGCQVI